MDFLKQFLHRGTIVNTDGSKEETLTAWNIKSDQNINFGRIIVAEVIEK